MIFYDITGFERRGFLQIISMYLYFDGFMLMANNAKFFTYCFFPKYAGSVIALFSKALFQRADIYNRQRLIPSI